MRIKQTLMCGLLAAVTLLTGCGKKYDVESKKPTEIEGFAGNVTDVSPKSGDLVATFEIEDYGTIKAVLFPEAAPVGVENFQKLCEAGYYKGLTIHRVVKDFMFQGEAKTATAQAATLWQTTENSASKRHRMPVIFTEHCVTPTREPKIIPRSFIS